MRTRVVLALVRVGSRDTAVGVGCGDLLLRGIRVGGVVCGVLRVHCIRVVLNCHKSRSAKDLLYILSEWIVDAFWEGGSGGVIVSSVVA